MPTSEHRDWQVLLVGGASGTGKTVLANQLARRFSLPLTQVDDVRLALQRVTTPATNPALHFFLRTPNVWMEPAEELKDRLIEVGRVVSRALEAIIAHHLDTPYPLILEGDGVLPALAAQSTFLGFDGSRVRSIFLYQPSEASSLATMTERGRGFECLDRSEQSALVQMAWLYGQWLRQEAEQRGLPTLSAMPQDTVLERAIAVVGR